MPKRIDAEKLKQCLHQEDFSTPDERWRPESEFAALVDAQPDTNNEWIYDRLPTKEEEKNGIDKILIIGRKYPRDLKAIIKEWPKKQVSVYVSNGYDEPKCVRKAKNKKEKR